MAEELHARARIAGPPFDMASMAHSLGFRVRRVPDLGGPMGMLVAHNILVIDSLDPGLTSMVIGHELAHSLNNEWGVIPSSAPEEILEEHMDDVAMALIIPRFHALVALLRKRRIDAVARLFGAVLPFAAFLRLARLAFQIGVELRR